jgi:hypothetical protein
MSNKYRNAADYPLDDFDEENSPRPEVTDMEKLTWSRCKFLKGLMAGATALMMGSPAMAMMASKPSRLAFEQVFTNGMNTVTVPKGYSWHVVGSWGYPLWSRGAEFDHATRGTAAGQMLSMGDNTDGMAVFTINGRSVMAQNNEYTNRSIIYGNRDSKLPENRDDVYKGKAAHDVSIFEMTQKDGQWSIVNSVPSRIAFR